MEWVFTLRGRDCHVLQEPGVVGDPVVAEGWSGRLAKSAGGNTGQGGLGLGLERIVRMVSGAGAAVQGQG